MFSLSLGEVNPLPPRTCLGTINSGGMIIDFFKNPLLELFSLFIILSFTLNLVDINYQNKLDLKLLI